MELTEMTATVTIHLIITQRIIHIMATATDTLTGVGVAGAVGGGPV